MTLLLEGLRNSSLYLFNCFNYNKHIYTNLHHSNQVIKSQKLLIALKSTTKNKKANHYFCYICYLFFKKISLPFRKMSWIVSLVHGEIIYIFLKFLSWPLWQ